MWQHTLKKCGEVRRKICFVIPAFHPLLYAGRTKRTFRWKTAWRTQPLTLTRQRHIAPGRTRHRGSVFAALRRDRADGGTRQRKRKAGGTPGGVSSCKKTKVKVISPYWEQSELYLTFSSVKFIENYWKDNKNQSIFSTEPKKSWFFFKKKMEFFKKCSKL